MNRFGMMQKFGNVPERMGFEPFGWRRHQNGIPLSRQEVRAYASPTTRRGYTGHEHYDKRALIHMNGRVYDPQIGRFVHWTLEAAAHGVTGGVIAELQGGKFGHGFLSSGLNKAVHSRFPTDMNPYLGGAISAMVGGTVSELTGGKFANGAVTAAMAYAFNQQLSNWKSAEERVIAALTADGIAVARQVRIAATLADGQVVEAVADYAYRLGDAIHFGEVKSGMHSKFSFNQRAVYSAMASGNVQVVGARALRVLGLDAGSLLRNAHINVHAMKGGRAWGQFAKYIGASARSAITVLGSSAFAMVEMMSFTSSVSAYDSLMMECPACKLSASYTLPKD